MKLYMSDFYKVEIGYPLDQVQTDMIYYIYQPLIGQQATHLYMMLYMESKRMTRFIKPTSITRLNTVTMLPLEEIEKNLRVLEAIGLLKTLVKHKDDLTQYLYHLQSPLSLRAFFKNQILHNLLKESLSEDDFTKTIQYFKVNKENEAEYDNITASFNDVFEIQHYKKSGKILNLNEEFLSPSASSPKVEYDIQLLLEALTQYQVNRSLLKEDDLKYIGDLGLVYSIDAMTLAGLVKESIDLQGLRRSDFRLKVNQYVDVDQVSSFKNVNLKQPIQYQNHSTENNPIVQHIKHLDSVSPYELLKIKQGGKEPVIHDLQIVEMLVGQLGLEPSVVNVLIDYVLGNNDGRLSKRYCEAVGATWARKNIHTGMDAYHELMKDRKPVEKTVHELEDVPQTKQSDSESLQELMKQLKEGQL